MPVSQPTLSVADLTDGSQATVTISGSTAGTTNTIYTQQVSDRGSTSWSSAGSRVGDGELTVAPGEGYFWWHVSSTDGSTSAVSNLVYQPVTDGDEAIHFRAMEAVQARLQQLELTDIPAERVYRHTLLDIHNVQKPCVVVCLDDGQETEGPGTNERDDVEYPVMVVILGSTAVSDENEGRKVLKWREQCMRACRYARLSGVTENKQCLIVPLVVINPRLFEADQLWSAFEVRFDTRQTRGLT